MTCMAKSPKLACEAIFSRDDIRSEGHTVVITKSADSYYRGVTSTNDKALLVEIKRLVEKDKPLASNTVEGYSNNKEYIILNVPSNGNIINIGFWWNNSGYSHLFIEGTMQAFK